MNYKLVNNVAGWFVFAIAAITYMATAETSASLWDCGEFISAANKLQVVHPPGAPLFLLMGRIFTLFASSPEQVPLMMNYFSALSTAFAILFLFWIITALARKLVMKNLEGEPQGGQLIAIIGAGMVGALACTFSDTMWFSAVEGEVYALSTFFIAIVLWGVMKWEANADKPGGNRWLIFMAFMIGLSIGVHLLSLLVIPVTVLVYYFKKYKPTWWGIPLALIVGFVILSLVQMGIIQRMTAIAANNERMIINDWGLPFNMGLLIYYLIVFSTIAMILVLSRSKRITWVTTFGTCFLIILMIADKITIGFYGIIIFTFLFFIGKMSLKSKNDFEALVTLLVSFVLGYVAWKFLLESYWLDNLDDNKKYIVLIPLMIVIGVSYLVWYLLDKRGAIPSGSINGAKLVPSTRQNFELFGLAFLFIMLGFSTYVMIPVRSAANTPINMNAPKDAFSLLSYLNREQYGDRPLLYGPQFDKFKNRRSKVVGERYYPDHEKGEYGIKGEKTELVFDKKDKVFFPRLYSADASHIQMYKMWIGEEFESPTQRHNFKYFFKYQIGYMWGRYFMWNFAGRQDDFQGTVVNKKYNGNWISGIPFIDDARLGTQAGIPEVMKDQKARNKLYMLPLIFGLLGLFFLFYKDEKWGLVFLFLFVVTGIMLIVYFNSPPREPRERDYTLVGSFYTFCIFIGLGVLFFYDLLKKYIPSQVSAISATILGLVAVPLIMGMAGKDDHNRHGRRMARDFAINFLESCPPNAILFTQGDNDTYPLWYAQEVEGIRPDVRVANLSLIGVDWYIDFLQKAANENAPVPFHKNFERKKYLGDKNNQVFYQQKLAKGEYLAIDRVMNFVMDDNKALNVGSGRKYNYFPTNTVKIDVNRAAIAKNNVVPDAYKDRIVDEIKWTIPFKGSGNNRYLLKNDLAILAVIGAIDWSRPICFANTVSPSSWAGLEKYMIQEGMMHRLVPVEFPSNRKGTSLMEMNTVATYDRLMENYQYGGLDEKEHFIDENTHRLMHGLRNLHIGLARNLSAKGEKQKTIEVLERMREKFPDMNTKYYSPYNASFGNSLYSYNQTTVEWIELYYKNGQPELSKSISERMIDELEDSWRFYNLENSFAAQFQGDLQKKQYRQREKAQYDIQRLGQIYETYKDEELYNKLVEKFPLLVQAKEPEFFQPKEIGAEEGDGL